MPLQEIHIDFRTVSSTPTAWMASIKRVFVLRKYTLIQIERSCPRVLLLCTIHLKKRSSFSSAMVPRRRLKRVLTSALPLKDLHKHEVQQEPMNSCNSHKRKNVPNSLQMFLWIHQRSSFVFDFYHLLLGSH